jgi:hypothetical protein
MPRFLDSPRLRQVANLSDLIAYLRDELGWPIAPDTVLEDLTFDWSGTDTSVISQTCFRPIGTVCNWRKRLPLRFTSRLLQLGHWNNSGLTVTTNRMHRRP